MFIVQEVKISPPASKRNLGHPRSNSKKLILGKVPLTRSAASDDRPEDPLPVHLDVPDIPEPDPSQSESAVTATLISSSTPP